MRQTNNIDCGLFAIAFVTSYCLTKQLKFDQIFDIGKMRSHLMACLEKGAMSEFPLKSQKLLKRNLGKKKPNNITTTEIELLCVCNMPECVENMVECVICQKWYHYTCVQAPANISQVSSEFECMFCERN